MEIQWPLLVFSVLLGISSGTYVFLAIGEIKGVFKEVRFKGALIALILLALGGCASVLHLGHPERATHLLANIGSGLSLELISLAILGIVGVIYLILSRGKASGASKLVGVLAGILGLVLPVVTGASYLMAARPAWDSITLPLLYLGGGLAAGFLLMAALVLYGSKAKEEGRFALTLALVGVVAMVVTVVAYLIWVAIAPHQAPERSIMRLVSGDLALAFWLGAVLIGVVVPVVLVLFARKKALGADGDANAAGTTGLRSAGTSLLISFLCVVAGSAVLRAIIYLIGTSVEQFIYK